MKKAFLQVEQMRDENITVPHWKSEKSETFIEQNHDSYTKFKKKYKKKLEAKVIRVMKEKNLTYDDPLSNDDIRYDMIANEMR